MNKVILLGRLGGDPELKSTQGGQSVANFSIATSERYTDKSGQKQEKTEWTRVVVWGKLAELCREYLRKGSQALIEGKLSTRQWEGKDGKTNYTTEVIASQVKFLDSKGGTVEQESGFEPGLFG